MKKTIALSITALAFVLGTQAQTLPIYLDETKPIEDNTLEKLIKKMLSVLSNHDKKSKEQLANQTVKNRHNNIYLNHYGLTQ